MKIKDIIRESSMSIFIDLLKNSKSWKIKKIQTLKYEVLSNDQVIGTMELTFPDIKGVRLQDIEPQMILHLDDGREYSGSMFDHLLKQCMKIDGNVIKPEIDKLKKAFLANKLAPFKKFQVAPGIFLTNTREAADKLYSIIYAEHQEWGAKKIGMGPRAAIDVPAEHQCVFDFTVNPVAVAQKYYTWDGRNGEYFVTAENVVGDLSQKATTIFNNITSNNEEIRNNLKNTSKNHNSTFDEICDILEEDPSEIFNYIDDIDEYDVDADVIFNLFDTVLSNIDDDQLFDAVEAITSQYDIERSGNTDIYDTVLSRSPDLVNYLVPSDERYYHLLGESLNDNPEAIEYIDGTNVELLQYLEPLTAEYIVPLLHKVDDEETSGKVPKKYLSYLQDDTFIETIEHMDEEGMIAWVSRCIPEERWTQDILDFCLERSSYLALLVYTNIPKELSSIENFKLALDQLEDLTNNSSELMDIINKGLITSKMISNVKILNILYWMFKEDSESTDYKYQEEDISNGKKGLLWLEKNFSEPRLQKAIKMGPPPEYD